MAVLKLDWNEYKKVARETVSEGVILLENNGILPVENQETISIFGRIQLNYYKSGTGSGGMVNVSKVVTIPDGLRESGKVKINEKLFDIYKEWEKFHPFNAGCGWGTEPWSQKEMEVTDEIVKEAAAESDLAMVIIGRTAGEDKDNTFEKGAFLLAEEEEKILSLVRKHFDKLVIVLNIASLMDLSMIDIYKPDAVLLVWTGGMEGGYGIADVITGKCPSGRLPDSVEYNINDNPAHSNFGDVVRNFYAEDIFVGYRYYETFAKDKVRYPFGYGLSYTSFDMEAKDISVIDNKIVINVKVTNTGNRAGKQVVQAYIKAPNGILAKPARVLIGYAKTSELALGASELVKIEASFKDFASFNDNESDDKSSQSWFIEKGLYEVFVGDNVRSAKKVYDFSIDEDLILEKLESALKPVIPYKRMTAEIDNNEYKVAFEDVPLNKIDEAKRRMELLPEEISQDLTKDYKLDEVLNGNLSMEEFISSLSDDDLVCLVRGEGMGSSLVTPGTAAAFAGVSESLRRKNVPALCCDDGPSGMRLDSGALAFSLPSGMILSSSFNDELVEKLYSYTSLEMKANKVECLLGPGMNIHRYPLNGRNFEYFSEDPLLTGRMAIANLKGLNKYGVTGTAKHFCANNQETGRLDVDAVVSERALREIYLRGFEMVVKSGELQSIMTTYGSVNGLWTAGNLDLNTVILRKQWGFKGIAMTDWWAKISERDKPASKSNYAQMVRAQNDIYMVCADAENNPRSDSVVLDPNVDRDMTAGKCGDNLLESLENGTLKRCELQRCAKNILDFAMNSEAMKRLINIADKVEVEGREDSNTVDSIGLDDYIKFDDEISFSLSDKESAFGTDYTFPLVIDQVGFYEISVTGSSMLNEVAQLPCTLYYTGVPFATFTFSGTNGKNVTITKKMFCHNRFGLFRLNVVASGLKLETITFKLCKKENS